MWAEHVGPETIDSRIWPRAAAVAERLWSPREVTDVADMYRRLAAVSAQLEEVGVTHASHTDRMLRRLVGGEDVAPLAALLEYAQPAYFWERSRIQGATQLTPLTRLVDAARPDPLSRFRIGGMVDALLADPLHAAYRDDLGRLFSWWRDLAPRIDALAASAPLAADALPAGRALADLGEAGLEALAYLGGGVAPPEGWLARVTPLLERAEQPLGVLRLPFAPAMRRLVAAAGTPAGPP